MLLFDLVTSNSDDAEPRGATVTKPLLICLPQHIPLILTGNGRETATRLTETQNLTPGLLVVVGLGRVGFRVLCPCGFGVLWALCDVGVGFV